MTQANVDVFFWVGVLIFVLTGFAVSLRRCKTCGERGHYEEDHCSKHPKHVKKKFMQCPECFFLALEEQNARAERKHEEDLEVLSEKVARKLQERQKSISQK